MSQKRYLKLANNYQAAYIEKGTGQPLLLLHGFMGKSESFLPLMENLSQNFRCLSLDLLGFGESSKPPIRYNIEIEVKFVRAFIEKLQLNPCYILGYSFGGWVASAYTLQFNHDVKSLFLVAPAGIRDDSFAERFAYLRPLVWETPIVDWGLSISTILSKITGKSEAIEKLNYFRQGLLEQPVARCFLRHRLHAKDAVDTVEKDIHRLNLPTLVISGAEDDIIPLWHSETYAQQIPNAQIFIIPDADHNLLENYHQILAYHIQEFLISITEICPKSTR